MRPTLPSLAVLLCPLAACAQGVIGDDPVLSAGLGTGDTGVATMVPEVDGQKWCARLPDPLGCDGPGTGDTPDPWVCQALGAGVVHINEPSGGGDPKGCQCAPPEVNTFLTMIENNGFAVVLDAAAPMYKNFRDAVYITAREKCQTYALSSLSIPPDFENCEYVIAQFLAADPGNEYPGLFKEGALGDCSAAADYEGDTTAAGMENFPGDSYKDYYSLGSVIVWDDTHSRYEIDADFFDDVLNNPGWLFEDSARVEWNGSKYVFSGVSSGTIAYALGLQNGDQPLTLNNWSLETIGKMLDAHHGLQGQTSYALVVKRNGNNVTINYLVR